jgi:O-antigen/teichoic acid export membrane protein
MAIAMTRSNRVAANLSVLYGAEMVSKFVALAVFGYLGATLGLGRYGDLEFAITNFFLANLVLEAGLQNYATSIAAQQPERTTSLAAQIILIRMVIVTIACSALFAIGVALDRDTLATQVIWLYGLALLPGTFILNWVFQSRDEMHVVAACSVLRQLTFALIAWLAVDGPDDLLWVPVADATGLALAAGAQQLIFRRSIGVLRPWKHIRGTLRVFRESLPLAISTVMWALRLFFPLEAMGLFTTSEQTGLFGAGHRLVVAMHMFVYLYFFNLLPTISRIATPGESSEYHRLINASLRLVSWTVVLGGSIASALAAPIILLVYGETFAAGIQPFSIMVWMLAAAFLSGHHRFSLIAFGHRRGDLAANAAGAIVTIAACLWFGSDLTPLLAAIIFVVGESVTLLASQLVLSHYVTRLKLVTSLVEPVVALAIAAGLIEFLDAGPFGAAGILLATFGVGLALRHRSLVRWLGDIRAVVGSAS